MQVQNIVRASAQAVTITTLVKGNVYKRIVKVSYGDDYTMIVGVVQSIDNNGEDCLISAFEVTAGYEPKVEQKVFGNSSTLSLFAITPAEAELFISGVNAGLDRKVQLARDALDKATDDRTRFHGLVATMGEITEPSNLLIGASDAAPGV